MLEPKVERRALLGPVQAVAARLRRHANGRDGEMAVESRECE